MTTLDNLHRGVQSVLAGKGVGTPVFVRYQVFSQDRGAAVIARLARLAAVVQGWLGQRLERVYATGSVKSGQIALTMEYHGGASALLSWARSRAQGDGVDLMLIGNHGVIYHDAGASVLWEDAADPLGAVPDKNLIALMQRALRSQRPELAGKE